ncbi:DEAD/DEAH box helicase [Puteibacter caeruleilacunae]|nr:DEAD/DEAH box helicase [Puteibacter caeruleilacunae]
MKIETIRQKVDGLIIDLQQQLDSESITTGSQLFESGECCLLSQSTNKFDFIVGDENTLIELTISTGFDEKLDIDFIESIHPATENWDKDSYACLLEMQSLVESITSDSLDHKKYTREGMIQRVLEERRQKANHANYRIKWSDNIYGDHVLTNENGVKYKIFLRDFENETGYSNSKDSAVNKLGTTKHIMYAFSELKNRDSLYRRLKKQCPFIEIYCDPLNDYAVTYFYPHNIPEDIQELLNKYFNGSGFVESYNLHNLALFFYDVQEYDSIVIRPEVKEKVFDYLDNQALFALRDCFKADFSRINATLYDYQKEGITFATCRKHAIIADEMGLGKTVQALGVSVLKKDVFGFSKTLIVCPASLKAQWKKEIEKFTNEEAVIVQGTPEERAQTYKQTDAFFMIVNYETVLRDQIAISNAKIDFLILDEAQKVKNYATKTASAIKNISRKHVLIITGTPIENKLIDLFSIMTILDPHMLGPLWEFSYQHCLFDNFKPNKINAYYNLKHLKEQLSPVLLRREKRKVIDELPHIHQEDIPVRMTPLQADFHASYASGIGQIINKKFLTAFDMQRLQQLLTGMRMVCDSTFLVDEATNDSPKLEELKYILLDKLELRHRNRKVIIFSEWVKMHKLIGQMLLENNIGFCELNGSIPTQKRGAIIKKFEDDENCKVFLSTEAGGAGLNLQVADILINFELPWNPAKKNQRIGRIDRLGQKSDKLTIFNLITVDSIEQRIALGLLVKQNLFESVLNEGATADFVDFTEKGRGQFLQQMKELSDSFDEPEVELMEPEEQEKTVSDHVLENEDFTQEIEEQIDFTANEENKTSNENIQETQKKPALNEGSSNGNDAEKTAAQMEQVMNNGMQFLSGLMQMATGKDVGLEDQKIEINKETGEVTMKFKIPSF